MEPIVIAAGCDHAGLPLKNTLLEYLRGKNCSVVDLGTYSADSCDYPGFAEAVCQKVVKGEA